MKIKGSQKRAHHIVLVIGQIITYLRQVVLFSEEKHPDPLSLTFKNANFLRTESVCAQSTLCIFANPAPETPVD